MPFPSLTLPRGPTLKVAGPYVRSRHQLVTLATLLDKIKDKLYPKGIHLLLPNISLLQQPQILGVADSAPLLVKQVPLVLS